MNEDILDLDALVPSSKHIKINGELHEVKPLTVQQLIKVVKLEDKLLNITNEEEILPLIKEALGPICPAIMEDKFEFTIPQLKAIMAFAQKTSANLDQEPETQKYEDPKKKDTLVKDSLTSSDSTMDTPQEQH